MWKKLICVKGISVLLVLFLIATVASAGVLRPNLAAAAEKHPQEKVMFLCALMGGTAYALGQGLEELTRKHHPWLRIVNAEGPGGTACTYKALTDPMWKSRIFCSTSTDLSLAKKGLAAFEKKPFPDVQEKVKILFNFAYNLVGLTTMDPKIKTEQDLAGKRVGLGRVGQTVFNVMQRLVLMWADPPVPNVKLDYLGTKKAVETMVDGAVDAACLKRVATPDFKETFLIGPENNLIALHRKYHWIDFTDRTVAKSYLFKWRKLPANTFGPCQPEPINIMLDLPTMAVRVDFPEELAYETTKFMIDYCHELPRYHKQLVPISKPENLCIGWKDKDYHPGALRAYKEAGLL